MCSDKNVDISNGCACNRILLGTGTMKTVKKNYEFLDWMENCASESDRKKILDAFHKVYFSKKGLSCDEMISFIRKKCRDVRHKILQTGSGMFLGSVINTFNRRLKGI